MAKRAGKNARPANPPAPPAPDGPAPDFAHLVSGLIHDLRAPLGTVVGAASTIEDYAGALDDRTRSRLCASIVGEAQRLDHLLTGLMTIARARAGTFCGEACRVELNELLHGLAAKLRERGGDRLRIAHTPQDVFMTADPAVIQTLFLAIPDLALEYAPEDSPIDASLSTADGNAVFSVICEVRESDRPRLSRLLAEIAPETGPSTPSTTDAVFLAAVHEVVHILGGEFSGQFGSGHNRLRLSASLPVRS